MAKAMDVAIHPWFIGLSSDLASVHVVTLLSSCREDVDLCIKLHMAGPSQGQQQKSRGHVKQVLSPVNVTSGRRLSSWSGLKATYIHFYIALRWYFGATPEQMYHIYHTMYTDTPR